MSAPRPGWYPDPADPAAGRRSPLFRWWDGGSWTAELSGSATAPAPTAPRPLTADAATAGNRAEDEPALSAQRHDELQHDELVDDTEDAGRARSGRPQRLVALLLGICLMITTGLVGAIGWRSLSEDEPADPPVPDPAATSAGGTGEPTDQGTGSGHGPQGRLDEVSREATIDDGRMILPNQPYQLLSDPTTVPGVFDAMFVAHAPVHERYDGTHTWSATVGLGHVPAQAWDESDPTGFAARAMDALSGRFFGDHPTTVKKLSYGATMIDGTPCAEVRARVHYKIKKLPSRYDRLRVIGCPADDGTVITAISSVPDDADPEVTRLAEQSLATLHID